MKRIIIADVKSFNRNGKSTGHYFSVADNYLDIFKNRCDVIVAGGPLYKKKYNKLLQLPFDTTPQGFGLLNKLKVIINMTLRLSSTDLIFSIKPTVKIIIMPKLKNLIVQASKRLSATDALKTLFFIFQER